MSDTTQSEATRTPPRPKAVAGLDDVEIANPIQSSNLPSPVSVFGTIRGGTGSTLKMIVSQGATTIEEYNPPTTGSLTDPNRLNYSQNTSDLAVGTYTVTVFLDPSTGSGSSKTRDFTVNG